MIKRFKKTIIATTIVTGGVAGTVATQHDGYVQLDTKTHEITLVKSNALSAFAVNLVTDKIVEKNIVFSVPEQPVELFSIEPEVDEYPLLRQLYIEIGKVLKLPAPAPTPTPAPTPVPTPVPPPPAGSEVADGGYRKMRFDEANLVLTTTAKLKVCVIDTGIAPHPDLPAPIAQIDFTGAGPDNFGHGTHVYGIIAAIRNQIGVRGGAYENVEMMVARVLGADGQGSMDGIAKGMRWCADNGARVINMSLGSSQGSQIMQQMVAYLDSKNIQTFMANGNDRGPVGSPARYGNKITSFAIAATDNNDVSAAFTSNGPETIYAAPGVQIMSTVPTRSVMCNGASGYCAASGTSMSTPNVAAVCVLHLLSGRTNCSNLGIGFLGTPNFFGRGRVDALKSVTN